MNTRKKAYFPYFIMVQTELLIFKEEAHKSQILEFFQMPLMASKRKISLISFECSFYLMTVDSSHKRNWNIEAQDFS